MLDCGACAAGIVCCHGGRGWAAENIFGGGGGGGGGGGTPGGNWEVGAGLGGIGTPTLPGGAALFVGGWLWNGVTIGGGLVAGAVCQGGFSAYKRKRKGCINQIFFSSFFKSLFWNAYIYILKKKKSYTVALLIAANSKKKKKKYR